MTIHATWLTQTQYWPADMLQQFSDWISPGVLSMQDLQVTAQSPAAMAVNVSGAAQNQSGGNAWLPGGYRLYNDAQLSLTIAAADTTNPRIDLVVCGIDTTVTPYAPTIKVIQGTPAASPSIPAVPSGYINLAQIQVPANATSISTSNITDKRVVAGVQGDGSRLSNLPIQPVNAATTTTLGTVEISIAPGQGQNPVAISTAEKGALSGVATLDGTGKVPSAQLPSMNYIPISQEGVANGVATLDGSGNVPKAQLGNVPPSNLLVMPSAWIG